MSQQVTGETAPPDADASLQQWLDWQERLHPSEIELGLTRIAAVFARMRLNSRDPRVLSIAGTNGKGSCALAAERLAMAAGWQVGCYTSPHLWRYNERVRINGEAVSDADLIAAFAAVESCRQGVSLSYFEFGTLAALYLFDQAQLDCWILEVGLGGRLDAVNIVDADVAVVTSIGLDHQDWLGSDLLQIAREKAAIARPQAPLLLGPGVPESARETGEALGARVLRLPAEIDSELPLACIPPGLRADNLRLALLALKQLNCPLQGVDAAACIAALRLPGRCQLIRPGQGEEIWDVAHNAEAAQVLAGFLSGLPPRQPTFAVFSALADKPLEAMVAALAGQIDCWCVAPLESRRSSDLPALQAALSAQPDVRTFADIDAALAHARGQAARLVVCGSFLTVAAAGRNKHG